MDSSKLVAVWPGIFAHASGGLWLADRSVLVLADLHLGYGFAQRRRGQLGPLADDQTRLKLFDVIDEVRPFKLLLLGDIVHAARPGGEEAAWIGALIREVAERAELICVRGNHDRQFAIEFQIPLVDDWKDGDVTAAHGDRLPMALSEGERLVVGHLHPAIGLEDAAGVRQKVPAFLLAGPVVVLPAFSPFAAGLDVWRHAPPEILRFSGGEEPTVIAATGFRAIGLGPLARLRSPARGSRPSDYYYRASK